MQRIFTETGPVFEAANLAFNAIFEGINVANALSKARHELLDYMEMPPEKAAAIVNMVKNAVFDPLAAPGAKPESDPTVKQYISYIPVIAKYVADDIIDGYFGELNENARRRTAYLGENIRQYITTHPNAPLTFDILRELDRASAFNSFQPQTEDMGYQAIHLNSNEELNGKLAELGAEDVAWCIRDEKAWLNYSNNNANTFYLLHNDSMPATDPNSLIGTFVTPGGRVASAFDRPNHAVNSDVTMKILASAGVKVSYNTKFSAVLKEGLYDFENLVDKCESLGNDVYLVQNNHGDFSNIVVRDKGHYRTVFPDWVDSEKFGIIYSGKHPLFATDGNDVYYLNEPYDKWISVPDGLTVTTEQATDEDVTVVYVKRDGRIVNILDIDDGKMLLDPASDVEFTESNYISPANTTYRLRPNVKLEHSDNWVLEYTSPRKREYNPALGYKMDVQVEPDYVYVVSEPGKNLADCEKIEIPVNFHVVQISNNGKYCAIRKTCCNTSDPDYSRYFIISNGKVSQESYLGVEDNGDGNWDIYNSTEKGTPYYRLNTNTGEIETRND